MYYELLAIIISSNIANQLCCGKFIAMHTLRDGLKDRQVANSNREVYTRRPRKSANHS